jgi:Uncharacterized conserved protein
MDPQKALADKLFPVTKVDDDAEYELRNIPPEQRRLHTETADMTVASLFQYMTNGKIEIPEFQRGYVWTRVQASRLIESLIIQCPIPIIYFSQGPANQLVVIDGNQRLLSIKLFLNDAFQLQGLTAYPELNGSSWAALDPRFRDHICNRTIRCITILKDTHPQIKFDVFERLNTGSVKLNAQELRHGLNHGRLMELLDKLSKNEDWKKIAGIRADKRMKGAELILRYFALREGRANYQKPLSSFLDAFSERNRGISEQKVAELEREFELTIHRVNAGLGRFAFRAFSENLEMQTQFNSALFDAEMIGFAETTNEEIIDGNYDKVALRKHIAHLLKSDAFTNAFRQATSDELSVKTRIAMFIQHLNGFHDVQA